MSKLTMLLAAGVVLSSACTPLTDPVGDPGTGGGGPIAATISIGNQTPEPIFYVFITACSDNSWGPDQLGDDMIPSGGVMNFTVSAGCYDVRVETVSGAYAQWFNVQVGPGDIMHLKAVWSGFAPRPGAAGPVAVDPKAPQAKKGMKPATPAVKNRN